MNRCGRGWPSRCNSPSARRAGAHATLMKDASSTDVIVHRGVALTSFYQCGDLYRVDPYSANTLGKESWNGRFPVDWGVSAHPKVDNKTGELLFFNYSKQDPYMHYGVVDQNNDLAHYVDIPLPGPRLPHDMAFTENYAILNDFPLFWDPRLLEHDVHLPRFYPGHSVALRGDPAPRLAPADIRWFEADPTFVLHFTNAYEDGDEIVLDGFFEGDPQPLDTGRNQVGEALSLPGAGSHAGPTAPVAAQPGHRRGQGRAAVGVHHRIRHHQPRLRQRSATATPTPPPASPAGSCSTDWSSTICSPATRSAIRSATVSTAARPRWRRGWAAAARTTAIWSP